MSAVVGVLNESLTESLKGFYKLRKAYIALDSIIESEVKYMRANGTTSVVVPRTSTGSSQRSLQTATDRPNGTTSGTGSKLVQSDRLGGKEADHPDDDNDDDEFFEADETAEQTTTSGYQGHIEVNGLGKDFNKTSLRNSAPSRSNSFRPQTLQRSATKEIFSIDADSPILAHPVDAFVHSGASLCFGLLLLLLSMVPPAFNKLMYIIGFQGDRERGLKLLWQATKFNNINGGMAGLMLCGFYNVIAQGCDILSDSSASAESIEGYPMHRLEALLNDMRARYPSSYLWHLEEARMQANRRNLELSISMLSDDRPSTMKQVHALAVFERSLQLLYAHRHEECAKSFVYCTSLNNWSHALYYYIAGTCHVALYRAARDRKDVTASGAHAKRVEELFTEVRAHVGKMKFLSRQLPFDVFVARKLNKWEARSKEWNVPFIDAIGVSPAVEMVYLWNGLRKMNTSQLNTSLEALAWSDDPTRNTTWMNEGLDEKAVLAFLRAVIYRTQGRYAEAKTILRTQILSHDRASFKGPMKDDWTCPIGHYEMAANLWAERDGAGTGGRDQGTGRNRKLVREAEEWIDKTKNWGEYELDARFGMKVTTGLEAIKKWRVLYDY